jgi:hypothetical protein
VPTVDTVDALLCDINAVLPSIMSFSPAIYNVLQLRQHSVDLQHTWCTVELWQILYPSLHVLCLRPARLSIMYLYCGRALMQSCNYSVAQQLCSHTTNCNKQCMHPPLLLSLPLPLSLSLPLSLPPSASLPLPPSLSFHGSLISSSSPLQPPYDYN